MSTLSMVLTLVSITAIHLALGGFTSGAFVLVYALAPMFLAPVLDDPHRARYWVAATIVAVLVAGVAELFIPHGNALSPSAQTILTVANLLGFCSVVLVPSVLCADAVRQPGHRIAYRRQPSAAAA